MKYKLILKSWTKKCLDVHIPIFTGQASWQYNTIWTLFSVSEIVGSVECGRPCHKYTINWKLRQYFLWISKHHVETRSSYNEKSARTGVTGGTERDQRSVIIWVWRLQTKCSASQTIVKRLGMGQYNPTHHHHPHTHPKTSNHEWMMWQWSANIRNVLECFTLSKKIAS